MIDEDVDVLYNIYYEELKKCAQTKRQQEGSIDFETDEEVSTKLKNILTIKGSVVTLTDDLMKYGGKKFMQMMEKIADQKSKREQEEPKGEDDKDENKMKKQRMEQGKKMFQAFAARLLEQRILRAYREKVAQDRQQQLIEELENEDRLRQEKGLKKQQEREKKKEAKRLEKQRQEQEKQREEQEKQRQEQKKLKMEEKMKQEAEERETQLRKIQKQEKKIKEEKEQRKMEKKERLNEKKKKQSQEETKKDKSAKTEEDIQGKGKKENPVKTEQYTPEKRKVEELTYTEENIPEKSLLPLNISAKAAEKVYTSPLVGAIGGHIMKTRDYEFSFFSDSLNANSTLEEDYEYISHKNAQQNWEGGWTALSNAVHEKLFSDLFANRNAFILSRAKEAYLLLNNLAESSYNVTPGYHSLSNMQGMMNMHPDTFAVNIVELYEVLNNSKLSQFECAYSQQQGCVVRMFKPKTALASIPLHTPSE
ncbi:hypothetical protein G6F56_009487 [Rhizopus delemar]|nr:hypothetical protein G6F56_009487 [Rhizopus delemar]